ncbi:MAG TPA: dephospho-CoA kinase [Alphaproteobacteria bacterium]|jgi:dephospho-CoA kinase|nr:dephospho-CoA kinase [Alphaproteobacteria bacterium]HIK87967.1 dephospho-CoA kinase [Alphaproteobacteria bacterium]
MVIIGLTGSIAMGKSVTSQIFNSYGVPVFNADKCVHQLLGPNGKLVSRIEEMFYEALVKINNIKYIDRVKLGSIVFKDKKKRRELEELIHPYVGRERKKWKEWAERNKFKAICYDVPLLFETQGEKFCNVVVVVSAPFFIQKQRALGRENMTKQKFNNILKNQMSDKEKRKRADFIVNSGIGYRFTRNQVKDILLKVY